MKSKYKFFLLMGIAVLLLVLSYFGAISKTLSVRSNYLKLKTESLSNANITQQLQLLASKEAHYDSLIEKMNLSDSSLENDLLKVLNQEIAHEDLKLKTFNAPHRFTNGTASYTTISFSLEGGFVPILKVLYELENTAAFGQILHLEFAKEVDHRSRKTSLIAKVLLQYVQ